MIIPVCKKCGCDMPQAMSVTYNKEIDNLEVTCGRCNHQWREMPLDQREAAQKTQDNPEYQKQLSPRPAVPITGFGGAASLPCPLCGSSHAAS